MDSSILVVGASVSAMIGVFAPFLIPFLYKLIEKVSKKDLTVEGKRLIITIISIFVSMGIMLGSFQWVGEFKLDAMNFAEFFLVNFLTIKGMIQTIYELIIKGIPSIDRVLDKVSK